MTKRTWIGLAVASFILSAPAMSEAQGQSCLYEGQTYDEGTTICQSGLRQTCMNGNWQSLSGERCNVSQNRQVQQPTGNIEVPPQEPEPEEE